MVEEKVVLVVHTSNIWKVHDTLIILKCGIYFSYNFTNLWSHSPLRIEGHILKAIIDKPFKH